MLYPAQRVQSTFSVQFDKMHSRKVLNPKYIIENFMSWEEISGGMITTNEGHFAKTILMVSGSQIFVLTRVSAMN